ncbi:hypothetical protein ABNB59_14680 [Paenibacillus larvae]|uniref:Uncharacterized protein n=3 Tax=root TaxID=1 RepID=A0A0K2CYJ4_9CAUD|nr:hypothetical protein [Paenibacillus larvae]YP_009193887.1 hypothetical protein HARRISON_74 [Paenibacillus phage Harrison]ALA12634.1 hypothetical protein PAISLEY_74 [Paenibacillus phage Paisley]UYL93257.1 hypothetical protein CALLAN_67 [Paenibacillus phage Callan]UYL93334.1 hypothetical protein DASH_69 [Paenibacillus phage Dash]UYL93407.1 hypothetical protein LILO_61 [Paenibacillus phage Lilo]ALA12473.1 hypothetical protein HARRISON_74 [Paenibacillus phage Harrison]
MFIAKKEFDRSLIGNAVYISGYDKDGYEWDTYALVKKVSEDTMTVVLDTTETEVIRIDDFDAGLKMEVVWERGTEDE